MKLNDRLYDLFVEKAQKVKIELLSLGLGFTAVTTSDAGIGVSYTYFGHKSMQKYLVKLKENDEKLAEHFTRYDIRWVKIFTDDDVVSKLVGLFV